MITAVNRCALCEVSPEGKENKHGSHSYMFSMRGALRKKELSIKHIIHCVPCQVGANAEEAQWTISWCCPSNE
jgi:hypothetical protein